MADREKQLVQALLKHYEQAHRGLPSPVDENDTAWEIMRRLAQEDDPEFAWQITLELLEVVDDYAVTYVAAGPLEDLIDFHGEKFIDRIEKQAEHNSRLRSALEMVVVGPWVRPELVAQLKKLVPNLKTFNPQD